MPTCLTFDMRGDRQPAEPDVGRPLDGRVRRRGRWPATTLPKRDDRCEQRICCPCVHGLECARVPRPRARRGKAPDLMSKHDLALTARLRDGQPASAFQVGDAALRRNERAPEIGSCPDGTDCPQRAAREPRAFARSVHSWLPRGQWALQPHCYGATRSARSIRLSSELSGCHFDA